MRRLITTTFLTLDGVMQAPGGPEEDPSHGFHFGGWQAPFSTADSGDFIGGSMNEPFDLLVGRKTYEIFAEYWPHQTGAFARRLNDATKYVASRSDIDLGWERSCRIEGDVVNGVSTIKATEGPDLLLFGSGNLLQSLLAGNVIDEMRILIYPLTIGSGKKLFAEGTVPMTLKPTKTAVSSCGVLMAAYELVDGVEVGTVSPE